MNLSNKSYQKLYESFEQMYPEFKSSVKEWVKCSFTKDERTIEIALKNGCYICFGTVKDEVDGWVWIADLNMSDKMSALVVEEIKKNEE